MKPRVGSYGETATVTRSPSTTRIRWRRTLPASLARTSWPLSSLTRKFPPFAIKMTSPSRCTSSSLLTGSSQGPLGGVRPRPWISRSWVGGPRGEHYPGARESAPEPRVIYPGLRGPPAASRHQRRDRPVHSHLLLAAALERRRPGPRVRGGAPVLALQPAPRRRVAGARSRRVRLLGRPAARLHAADPPHRARPVTPAVRRRRLRRRPLDHGPDPRPAPPAALG